MHAVEAETKKMLNLPCRTQSAPGRRLIGARDGWQARQPRGEAPRISTPKATPSLSVLFCPDDLTKSAAALSPRTRWVEKALHENEIEPATELVAYLPEVGDTLEPYALVKADRSIVRCVNSADHDVFSQAQSKGK
jgi:hypothetical protein